VNPVRDAGAAIESNQISAATEEDVLTVVNDLAHARMQVRTGAPAQVAATLDQLHAQARLCQGAGSAHAGHTAADYRDGSRGMML
jgi:hypothetical protein